MAERRATKDSSPDAKGDRGKDAKVEFQEYKRRMDQATAAGRATASFHPGSPVGPQMGFGVWPPHVAPSAGPSGYGLGGPFQSASPGLPTTESASSLLGGLGLTLRLAVDLLNSGLVGGTRILQEISQSGLSGLGGGRGRCGCDTCSTCCEMSCQSCCTEDCCQPAGCGCESCTPSVGTCC